MHARKQIRDAVITLLAGLTMTGSRVFSNRLYNFEEADLPCLNVIDMPDDELIELSTLNVGTNNRVLSLRIEGRVKANAGLEDALDLIASEVETVLDGSHPASNKVRCGLVASSKSDAKGDKPHGKINLDFDIKYNTVRGAPDTIV